MPKLENRAILSTGRGPFDGVNTSERAFGAAGSFSDLLKISVTSRIGSFGFERWNDTPLEGHPIAWLHTWRGMPSNQLRASRLIRPRPKPGHLVAPAVAGSDGVPGLLAIPFPSPNGELTSLVNEYCHQLGSAGGPLVLWRPIGDPRLKDEIFRRYAEADKSGTEQGQVAEFLAAVAAWPSAEHFINGEYQKATEALGIRLDELPVIVFVASHPVFALAALHLDVAMFENATRRKLLAAELVERLGQERIGTFATDGRYARSEMAALQTYMHQAATEIRSATLGSAGVSGQELDASAYAMIYSHDRPPRAASKSEYLTVVRDRANYEFFINAVDLYCLKPDARGTQHQTQALTPADVRQIRHFVTSGSISRPCSPIGGYVSEPATDRSFQAARKKVDVKVGRCQFTLFKRHPRHIHGKSAYEFAPPPGTRWLYVEPIVKEPALE